MYPVWEVPVLTAGWIIALMASFHILPSHLSVSAMWFNLYIESKAYREKRPELLEFVKKYILMLLVFAYVFGSLSGVGIWFSIMVVSPRATSGLIHNYVWGWATEWVFFIIEVIGIFVYYYTFSKISQRAHIILGWIFAISSWITMIIITGIISFQLSPGLWPKTGNFFDGFFNRTYFPQLFLRTFLMFSLAAIYAITVAGKVKNSEVRKEVVKKASVLGVVSFILTFPMLIIYIASLPEYAKNVYDVLITHELKRTIFIPFFLVLVYFFLGIIKPLWTRFSLSIIMIVFMFLGILGLERGREILRKPFVIGDYMYSNGIIGFDHYKKGVKSDLKLIEEKEGFLKAYPFTPPDLRGLNDTNLLKAGRLLALLQCSSCHSLGDKGIRPINKMIERVGLNDVEGVVEFLEFMSEMYDYMPPFLGNDLEKKALAKYLVYLKFGLYK
jgi:cytochrome bd-type quinol oxidase subunit 1